MFVEPQLDGARSCGVAGPNGACIHIINIHAGAHQTVLYNYNRTAYLMTKNVH